MEDKTKSGWIFLLVGILIGIIFGVLASFTFVTIGPAEKLNNCRIISNMTCNTMNQMSEGANQCVELLEKCYNISNGTINRISKLDCSKLNN